VILAAQGLPTELFTWRTGARTALLVTRMSLAISGLLALSLAGEGPGALHLLHLGPAPAPLARHLQAGGAVTTVASLIALVTPTPQQLPTRVTTGGGRLCAGQPGGGLAAGAEPVQGEGAWRTFARVTDEVTGMVSTGEERPTRCATLKLRRGAWPWLLGLQTFTRLHTGL